MMIAGQGVQDVHTHSNVVDLSSYRRETAARTHAIKHTKDELLVVLRKLAPSVDDVCLSGFLDRVANAWAIARGGDFGVT